MGDLPPPSSARSLSPCIGTGRRGRNQPMLLSGRCRRRPGVGREVLFVGRSQPEQYATGPPVGGPQAGAGPCRRPLRPAASARIGTSEKTRAWIKNVNVIMKNQLSNRTVQTFLVIIFTMYVPGSSHMCQSAPLFCNITRPDLTCGLVWLVT